VILHIRYKDHAIFGPHFTDPANLMTTTTIRLSEALLGFNRILFTHLDGRGIRVDSKRGERIIQPGSQCVIKGEGMPKRGKNGEKGDLWVIFEIEMPSASWAARQDPNVSEHHRKMSSGLMHTF
jgi:DnaJ family protein A protein 2